MELKICKRCQNKNGKRDTNTLDKEDDASL